MRRTQVSTLINRINQIDIPKYIEAIFKRHHDKPFTDPEVRKEAQKRNALYYYYRKKLIKLHKEIETKETSEEEN